MMKGQLKLIILKIETDLMLGNRDSNIWIGRTLNFLNLLNNVIKNIEVENDLPFSSYLSLNNLVHLYKKTGDIRIEYYLSGLPGFPFKDNKLDIEAFEAENEDNKPSYQHQHYYLVMETIYNRKTSGLMLHLNNYEVFIYFDKFKSALCLSYIGCKSYFRDVGELLNVIKIIRDQKIVTENEFKLAQMLAY